MPVTKQQAQALASLIAASRPYGAHHWDTAGIYAAISRVKDRTLTEVIRAFTRGADDRTAETPAVVVTNPAYWIERSPERPANHPPRADQMCPVHGGHATGCVGCAGDRLAGEASINIDPPAATTDPAIRELIDQAHAAIKAANTKA